MSQIRGFWAVLLGLACPACFMGPVAENAPTSSLSTSEAECQMTVQNSSFAGLCAQIQISNTGLQTMSGWEIDFDLPAASHMQNSWDANFTVVGQHVVVKPLSTNPNINVGDTVTLGYCASQTGLNLVATPGLCNDTQGSAITQSTDSNTLPGGISGSNNIAQHDMPTLEQADAPGSDQAEAR